MIRMLGLIFAVLLMSTGVMLDYSLRAKARGASGYAFSDYLDDRMALLKGVPADPAPASAVITAAVPAATRTPVAVTDGSPLPLKALAAGFAALRAVQGGSAALTAAAAPVPQVDIAANQAAMAQAAEILAGTAAASVASGAPASVAVDGTAAEAIAASDRPTGIRQSVGRLTDRSCATRAGTKFCAVASD